MKLTLLQSGRKNCLYNEEAIGGLGVKFLEQRLPTMCPITPFALFVLVPVTLKMETFTIPDTVFQSNERVSRCTDE